MKKNTKNTKNTKATTKATAKAERVKVGIGAATAKAATYKNGGAQERTFVVKVSIDGGAWEDVAPFLIANAKATAKEAVKARDLLKTATAAERTIKAAEVMSAERIAKAARERAATFGRDWGRATCFRAALAAIDFVNTEAAAATFGTTARVAPSVLEMEAEAKRLNDEYIKNEKEREAKREAEAKRRAAMSATERIAEDEAKARAKAEEREAKAAEREAKRSEKEGTKEIRDLAKEIAKRVKAAKESGNLDALRALRSAID